jgi:arsenate reductase (thioredoxin)
MAEYFLKSLDPSLETFSAGTRPADRVHPRAIDVMREISIDLHGARTKSVDEFLNQRFDYVITVCDNARESCPVFTGEVQHRLHIGFDDPAEAIGSDVQIMAEFRRVRDEIRKRFTDFYLQSLKPKNLR